METKENYIPPKLEIIKFQVEDIITTSATLTPTTGTVNVDGSNATVEIVAKW